MPSSSSFADCKSASSFSHNKTMALLLISISFLPSRSRRARSSASFRSASKISFFRSVIRAEISAISCSRSSFSCRMLSSRISPSFRAICSFSALMLPSMAAVSPSMKEMLSGMIRLSSCVRKRTRSLLPVTLPSASVRRSSSAASRPAYSISESAPAADSFHACSRSRRLSVWFFVSETSSRVFFVSSFSFCDSSTTAAVTAAKPTTAIARGEAARTAL